MVLHFLFQTLHCCVFDLVISSSDSVAFTIPSLYYWIFIHCAVYNERLTVVRTNPELPRKKGAKSVSIWIHKITFCALYARRYYNFMAQWKKLGLTAYFDWRASNLMAVVIVCDKSRKKSPMYRFYRAIWRQKARYGTRLHVSMGDVKKICALSCSFTLEFDRHR